eukprot:GHRR01025900.1.p2 GENE.GHRR01025900.1~~GHRR01025900.1.p2  ORF type:complete len:104 (+),score=40.41 GHRR01025900.1:925-1236(+)
MLFHAGLALGAFLGETRYVSDGMLMATAETLPKLIGDEDVQAGLVYPRLQDIRALSAEIAAEVIKVAALEGHVGKVARRQLDKGPHYLLQWIKAKMFHPQYTR